MATVATISCSTTAVNGVWVEAFSQDGFSGFDYPASGQWDPGWQVIPADLNGDGRMDVFLLNAAGGHVSALSRPGGGFDYVGGPQWSPGWSVAPGDLNDDGTDGSLSLQPDDRHLGRGLQRWRRGFHLRMGQWDPGWAVAVTHFNDDGRVDLMLSRGRHVGPGHQYGRRGFRVCCGQLGAWLDGDLPALRRAPDLSDRQVPTLGRRSSCPSRLTLLTRGPMTKPRSMFARLAGVAATVVAAFLLMNQVPVGGQQTPVGGQQTPVQIPDRVLAVAGQGQLASIIVGVRVDNYRPKATWPGQRRRRSAPMLPTAWIRWSSG